MAINRNYAGTPYNATATGTTAATATKTGVTGSTHYVTDITVTSDLTTSTFQIKKGSTVMWQGLVGASYVHLSFESPLAGTVGGDVSVTVDGTSACSANIAGYTV